MIHSFWVPQMGQKQDAVPGIHTRLVITPTRLGTFPVICTELCGLGHATMRTSVRVVTPAAVRGLDAGTGEPRAAEWRRRRRTGGGGGGSTAQRGGREALRLRGLRRLPCVHARRHRRAGRALASTTSPPLRRRPPSRSTSSSASRSSTRTRIVVPGLPTRRDAADLRPVALERADRRARRLSDRGEAVDDRRRSTSRPRGARARPRPRRAQHLPAPEPAAGRVGRRRLLLHRHVHRRRRALARRLGPGLRLDDHRPRRRHSSPPRSASCSASAAFDYWLYYISGRPTRARGPLRATAPTAGGTTSVSTPTTR